MQIWRVNEFCKIFKKKHTKKGRREKVCEWLNHRLQTIEMKTISFLILKEKSDESLGYFPY